MICSCVSSRICQDITEPKEAEQQIRAANAALSEELKERTRAEKEISALSARLITAQEQGRTRIARETAGRGKPANCCCEHRNEQSKERNSCGRAPNRPKRAYSTKLVHVAKSIRRLSHDLHPAILQYSGLSAALRTYCSEFGSLTGVNVLLNSDDSFHDLPSDVALCFYRVAQEALQNVLKNAKVTEASVTLRRSAGILYLTVSDAGAGIDLSQKQGKLGLGLISMRERARLIKGTIDIETRPDHGTTLTLKAPV